MFLEHHDLYTAGAHTFLQYAEPLVEAPGECRSNHWLICELGRRLGGDHAGFGLDACEIIDRSLRASDRPALDRMARAHWHDCAVSFEQAHFLTGFPTADGRFHFRPDWRQFSQAREDMPALPDHYPVTEAADPLHPFRLVTAPARWFLNSTFNETPGSLRRERRPRVKLHPRDAGELGIADGDPVALGNRRGRVELAAELFEGLQRGVCVVESIWPNRAFDNGCGINTLTSADPGPPNGGAVFHDTAIWIRPAGQAGPDYSESASGSS